MGTTWLTPSPESNTTPVVRPDANLQPNTCQVSTKPIAMSVDWRRCRCRCRCGTYKLSTACTDKNKAGELKVSKKISAAFSRWRRGFSGASVSSTGCSSGRTASAAYALLHRRSMSSQSRTRPCAMGYEILSKPRSSSARSPTTTISSSPESVLPTLARRLLRRSSSRAPSITRVCLGRPTLHTDTHHLASQLPLSLTMAPMHRRTYNAGIESLGSESPAIPAFSTPEP